MAHLMRYDSTATIPLHLEVQVRALLSAEWPDSDEDATRPLTYPQLHPMYFIITDEEQVISYARTIWAMVSHLGQSFKLYGLGDVVTKPQFRCKGYGRRIVEKATTHIKSDREADAALLLTAPSLESFYQRSGWESIPELRVMTGEYDESNIETALPMMMFISAKAHTSREVFFDATLVLSGDEW